MSLHVAIAIVSFRNPGDVEDCLAALAQARHRDFEVVICENGGEAAFAELKARTPAHLPSGQPVQLICAPSNLGFAGGVNVCMRRAPDAAAWWVLNPDTQPDPDALSALVERLARGDCQAVGGTIQLGDGRVQSYGGLWQRWLARAVSLGYGDATAADVDAGRIERTQNYLNGASMLIGREFLEATGPMREDYFLYCEEVEWCLRGLKRGMRLGFAPQGVVLHKQGTSTGASADLKASSRLSIYLGERNRILLTRDCFPALVPVTLLTALGVALVRCAKRGAWRQFAYGLQGWAAGLFNRRGVPRWAAG
ncbi:glycosyltransferase family 2 protein [Phenylobacterium sp.]|uniref:glycosyltransferase family 2 protein n=1 Tax=Phenylobacterium sp. TaxID=1871053 RepID=UPI00356B2592